MNPLENMNKIKNPLNDMNNIVPPQIILLREILAELKSIKSEMNKKIDSREKPLSKR